MKKVLLFIMILAMLPVMSATADTTGKLGGAIVLYVNSTVALVDGEEVTIDEAAAVYPILESGRTLIPVRFVAESLGMDVGYDEKSETVSLTDDGKYDIKIKIGADSFTVNGKDTVIDADSPDVTAKTVNDRTFIPMRSLAEAVGKEIFYDRGIIVISDTKDIFDSSADRAELDAIFARVNVLPAVGSAENLQKLLGYDGYRYDIPRGVVVDMPMSAPQMSADVTANSKVGASVGGSGGGVAAGAPAPMAPMPDMVMMESAADSGPAYSDTNTQVEGVDEADLVKTDGKYLYQLIDGSLIITKVYPADEMKIESVTAFDSFYPTELYIAGDKLAMLGNHSKPYNANNDNARLRMYREESYARCVVYDVSDRAKPVLERTVDVEGYYTSSRRIGDYVYTLTTTNIYYVMLRDDCAIVYEENGAEKLVDYGCVRYFPNFEEHSFITVSSVNLFDKDEESEMMTMLGASNNVYVSLDNMYVANSSRRGGTNIYKFALDEGKITYLHTGNIEGEVLNQFSMDEHNGYFRIAATTYNRQTENNLYILDETLSPCGSINGIAPGELIYSARFVGDRGYMVTFRQIDPLFAMDLSDPYNPTILGQLKIPGYSDYLHPVDANHILGFGKDATNDGLYQGMKMALFDVTDPQNPTQKFEEIIGGRGTESALLQTHKALLFDPGMGLLAFPVTVREVEGDNRYQSAYGSLTFSGAYVYDFGIGSGFDLRGKITHLSDEDIKKLGNYVSYDKEISRIMYVGDSLITISPTGVFAHDIDTVEYKNSIEIKR